MINDLIAENLFSLFFVVCINKENSAIHLQTKKAKIIKVLLRIIIDSIF